MTIATATLKSLAPRPLAEMADDELRAAFWEAVGLSALAAIERAFGRSAYLGGRR